MWVRKHFDVEKIGNIGLNLGISPMGKSSPQLGSKSKLKKYELGMYFHTVTPPVKSITERVNILHHV